MNNFAKTTLVMALSVALGLGGCAESMIKPQQDAVNKDMSTAQRDIQHIRNVDTAADRDDLSAGVWIPAQMVASSIPQDRPAILSKRITVDRTFASIFEAAETITRYTSIPVSVSQDVTLASGTVGAVAPVAASPQSLPAMPGSAQFPMLPGAVPTMSNSAIAPIVISFDGEVSHLLDTISANYGISWEYRDSKIQFFRLSTRTFTIHALAGDSNIQSSVSDAGQTSVSGGSAAAPGNASGNQTSISATSLSVWKSLDEAVKSMLSKEGKVVVTPALGTITVTDTPMMLARVTSFIEQQNASLSKQVVVNVQVLSVTLNRDDNYGINWGLVYSSVSKNAAWSFNSVFAGVTAGASALGVKVLSPTSDNLKSIAGSNALISALSEQGHVSVVTETSSITLNNQPVPMQVGTQTSYLASSATTSSANVGSTTTLTPGVVSTGFSMSVIPHILDTDNILLQYGISLSSLSALNTVTSGTSSIQTPTIDTRNFVQRVGVRSGDTIVLTGFEQNQTNTTSQGVGSPSATWFGGGITGQHKHTVFVILVRPVIANPV